MEKIRQSYDSPDSFDLINGHHEIACFPRNHSSVVQNPKQVQMLPSRMGEMSPI